MSVVGDDWCQYVVVEGTARIVDDDPVPLLRHVYEGIAGKPHSNWQEFDDAMVRDHRAVLVISVQPLYPLYTGSR